MVSLETMVDGRVGQIAAVLGGNVRVISTGSAPMSPDAMNFLKVAIGADVLEGAFYRRRSGSSFAHPLVQGN